MRLGIASALPHRTPEEFAEKHRALGCGAVTFPVDHTVPDGVIDAYARACKAYDLSIAEVGAWSNPFSTDPDTAEKALILMKNQLQLAERVGARCCVNIAGGCGEVWDGGYAENYAEDTRRRLIDMVREIIDEVKPTRTHYSLEPMPWMLPDSPECYLTLLEEIDRPGFGAHLDVVNMINNPGRYFQNTAFINRCFRVLKGRILSCHAKDIQLQRTLTLHLKEVPCGQGALDLETYMAKAHAADPDMPFMIEHLSTTEEYIESFAYLKGIAEKADISLR